MSRMCGTCKGTGLLTSLDQLQRSTAPKTVPCHTCRGRGFVEDVIDLVTENKLLKAKLDEIRAECNKTIMTTSDVFGGGVASGHNFLKQNILAIIDKDGNET